MATPRWFSGLPPDIPNSHSDRPPRPGPPVGLVPVSDPGVDDRLDATRVDYQGAEFCGPDHAEQSGSFFNTFRSGATVLRFFVRATICRHRLTTMRHHRQRYHRAVLICHAVAMLLTVLQFDLSYCAISAEKNQYINTTRTAGISCDAHRTPTFPSWGPKTNFACNICGLKTVPKKHDINFQLTVSTDDERPNSATINLS